ncbi:hypothetical protein ACHAXR_010312 [Thalassiosira sp. AJA248-18]
MQYTNNSLSQDTAEVANSLWVMMQQEQKLSCSYLDQSSLANVVTESDRMKMVDWCYNIIDNCQFDRETVTVAMQMVDRFLSEPSSNKEHYLNSHQHFQLLTMAALYIAIKTNETVIFGSSKLVEMSNGVYSAEDIEATELIILQGLEWRICVPTSIQIAHHILSLILPHVNLEETTWDFILNEVRFQTEHAVRDYYLSSQRPSAVALSAITNVLDAFDHQVRDCVVDVLLMIMGEILPSPSELLASKTRLNSLVEASTSRLDGRMPSNQRSESSFPRTVSCDRFHE